MSEEYVFVNSFSRVVSVDELRKAPLVINRYVTRDGLVFKQDQETGEYVELKQHESPTSVGSYKVVPCITTDGHASKTPGVHVLVCRAFNGPPPDDGKIYEVNHKDGDKHNNVASNLEWATRSQNTLHAIDTGLRRDNVPIVAVDVTTGEEIAFQSINRAALFLDVSRHHIYSVIIKHLDIPYRGRWLFKVDKERFGKVRRRNVGEFHAKCHRTGRILIGESAVDMGMITGVKASSIVAVLRQKRVGTILGGYSFRDGNSETEWPICTPEQAEASYRRYQESDFKRRQDPVVCKYLLTGEEVIHRTPKLAAAALGVSSSSLATIIRNPRNDRFLLLKGWVAKYRDDPTPWPEMDLMKIKLSVLGVRPDNKPLVITDLQSNTTKVYYSVADFAKEIGKDPDAGIDIMGRKGVVDRYKWRYATHSDIVIPIQVPPGSNTWSVFS